MTLNNRTNLGINVLTACAAGAVIVVFAAGYGLALALQKPTLNITIDRRPPAPMVGYWSTGDCVVFTDGDLEVTGKGAIGTVGNGNTITVGPIE